MSGTPQAELGTWGVGWCQGPAGALQTGPWPGGLFLGSDRALSKRWERPRGLEPRKLSPELSPKGHAYRDLGSRPLTFLQGPSGGPWRAWTQAGSRGWVWAGQILVRAGFQRLPGSRQKVACPARLCVRGGPPVGVRGTGGLVHGCPAYGHRTGGCLGRAPVWGLPGARPGLFCLAPQPGPPPSRAHISVWGGGFRSWTGLGREQVLRRV